MEAHWNRVSRNIPSLTPLRFSTGVLRARPAAAAKRIEEENFIVESN